MSNQLPDLSGVNMPSNIQEGVRELCGKLCGTLGDNLKSIILYGSGARKSFRPEYSDVNLLLVMDNIDVTHLRSVLDPIALSRRYGVAPFFMTGKGLVSSSRVFPIKFLSMKQDYRVLWGKDVFQGLEVGKENLKLRCEQEALNLLFRLRRHYIMRSGSGLCERMTQNIGYFMETLRMTLSINIDEIPSREEVAELARETFGIDPEILKKVQEMKASQAQLPRDEAEKLYDELMGCVTKVIHYFDQQEKEGNF